MAAEKGVQVAEMPVEAKHLPRRNREKLNMSWQSGNELELKGFARRNERSPTSKQ